MKRKEEEEEKKRKKDISLSITILPSNNSRRIVDTKFLTLFLDDISKKTLLSKPYPKQIKFLLLLLLFLLEKKIVHNGT